jgi:hypothetical protein
MNNLRALFLMVIALLGLSSSIKDAKIEWMTSAEAKDLSDGNDPCGGANC